MFLKMLDYLRIKVGTMKHQRVVCIVFPACPLQVASPFHALIVKINVYDPRGVNDVFPSST